jgi:hypothetical protein
MTCREARRKLSEYAAGELSAEDAERVAEHLARCEVCRAEAGAYRGTEEALRALARVKKAPDLTEDLHRRTAAPRARRRRWAWAGALAVPVAVAVLLWPRAAPVETLPVVEHVEVRVPQVPARGVARQKDVAVAEIAPESVRAPRLAEIQGETVSQARPPEQVMTPAVVSVPVRVAQPAEFEEETTIEAAPVMASLTSQSEPAGGVVLLLGRSERARHSSSCYLEVSLPNGARSVFERVAKLEAAGTPRVIEISYEQIAPQPKAQDGGG